MSFWMRRVEISKDRGDANIMNGSLIIQLIPVIINALILFLVVLFLIKTIKKK